MVKLQVLIILIIVLSVGCSSDTLAIKMPKEEPKDEILFSYGSFVELDELIRIKKGGA